MCYGAWCPVEKILKVIEMGVMAKKKIQLFVVRPSGPASEKLAVSNKTQLYTTLYLRVSRLGFPSQIYLFAVNKHLFTLVDRIPVISRYLLSIETL